MSSWCGWWVQLVGCGVQLVGLRTLVLLGSSEVTGAAFEHRLFFL